VAADPRPLWRRGSGYVLVLAKVPAVGAPARPYDPAPTTGRVTRFDLLAEVSRAKTCEGGTRSTRVDLILEARNADRSRNYPVLAREAGTRWLAERGRRCGFELLEVNRADYEVAEFLRRGHPVRIGGVRFSGVLKVSDSEAMKRALLQGIGHCKAWGFGLLICLRPSSTL